MIIFFFFCNHIKCIPGNPGEPGNPGDPKLNFEK